MNGCGPYHLAECLEQLLDSPAVYNFIRSFSLSFGTTLLFFDTLLVLCFVVFYFKEKK